MLGLIACTAAPITKIDGRVEATKDQRIVLIDRRAPIEKRSLKIDTPDGVGDRLDDKLFEQSPVEALARALEDFMTADGILKIRGPVEVMTLDVAVADGRGRPVRMDSSQAGVGGGAYAVAGGVIAQALVQVIEDRKAPRPMYVKVALQYDGNTIGCEGTGYFRSDEVAIAWLTAIRNAAVACAAKL